MALGLYPQLLGPNWKDVAPSVQRLHLESGPVQVAGCFCVRHGSGRLARRLIRALRLPSAGEAVPVRLMIDRDRGGEKLFRTFAGQPFITVERAGGKGLLAERSGLLELLFRLVVDNGGIVHRQIGAVLRFGLLAIPLPRWLAPQVTAFERPVPGTEQAQVSVRVVVPWIGLLISYEGRVAREETA